VGFFACQLFGGCLELAAEIEDIADCGVVHGGW
jgi:hypothetical protein